MNKSAISERTELKPRLKGRKIMRFSRLPERALPTPQPQSAKAMTAEQKEDQIAELDAKAFHWLARGREANTEVGRAFNELKVILGHGKWQRHFAKTFAPRGITLRTAENYMRLAHNADPKIEKLSTFKPASDPEATEIRKATEKAQAEVGDAVHQTSERKQIYKLALHLSIDDQNAADRLWKSPHRPRAEKEIVRRLKQLCVEFGIVNDQAH